ncbi:MAG: hypothetical protein QOI23_1722 [Chloroflexota bacterium]|nr:hypothetical protein [Chloroflexota bacterium]
MKRPLLLAAAASVYLMAAWMVAPGFYDGFAPQPYNWTSPPPQAVAGNLPPRSGHLVIKVIDGVSDANSAFTEDGQMVIGFLPGAFDVIGKTSVTVDIKPESAFPAPTGLHFATNVYLVTADAPLVMAANLVLKYSDLVPAPSNVYLATGADAPWTSIGGADTGAFAIQTKTSKLGYFAAGYPGNATSRTSSGASQLLPIAVAVLILGVVIAGIPLAVVRRRRGVDEVEEDEDEPDDATPST